MKQLADPALDAVDALKCELAGDVLRSSGSLRFAPTGSSMLPTILPGDVLTLERAASEGVSKGDIVLFTRNRRLFAHRVVEKVGESSGMRLITQGDGMALPDPPVTESELLGKVAFILRNGRLIHPSPRQRLSERAVSVLVRRFDAAARIVVGLHQIRQTLQEQPTPCQS